MSWLLLLLLVLLWPATTAAQQSGMIMQDGNVTLGRATTLQCVSGVTCGLLGSTGTLTVTGGPGGGSPGGSSGAVQFNNVGNFGGFGNWDGVTFTIPKVKVTTRTGTAATVAMFDAGGVILEVATLGNAFLTNPATTVNGQTCTLGSSCTVTAAPSGAAGGDLSGTYPSPTVAKVNGVSYPITPATNTVPVVTASNTVTYQTVPNAALTNSSVTVSGTTNQISTTSSSIALGGSATLSIPATFTMPGTATVTTRTGTPATFATFDSSGKLVEAATYAAPAPATSQYWVGALDATLTNEKNLGALTTGLVLNTAGTPSAYAGTSCTNQFPRSLNASGAATCATVANTDLTNSSITINGTSVALGGTRTLTLASADFANQGTTSTVLHGNVAGNPAFGAIVSADLNITATTCTNQFIRNLSAAAGGTCASVANADLVNSSVTVNGTTNQISTTSSSIALGGSATLSIPATFIMPGTAQVTTRTGTPNTFATFDSAGKLVDGATYAAPAPAAAQYWTGAADGTLSAEKNLGALTTGLVLNTSGTPTAYAGTSCTNQFPRSLNASGTATCASVANTDLTNSAITINGTSTALGGSINVGTVTSVTTTGPLTGVSVTTTPILSCPTCNTLSDNPFVMPASANITGGIIGGTALAVGIHPIFGPGTAASAYMPGMPGAGYLRNLTVTYNAAQVTGARTFWRLNIDRTGNTLQDLVSQSPQVLNSAIQRATLIRLMQGNQVEIEGAAGSTLAAASANGWAAEYIMDSGGQMVGASHNNTGVGAGVTRYVAPYSSAITANINQSSGPAPFGGTLKNLCLMVTPATDGTLVATMMVNGVATAITVTATAAAGESLLCDLTNTASIATDQPYALRVVNNGTGPATLKGWTAELDPTSGTPGILGGHYGLAVSNLTSTYIGPFKGSGSGTEATERVAMPRAGTMTKLCLNRQVASSIGATTATIFKNGSSSGQLTMTVGNATGVQCVTGSVAIAPRDMISLEIKNTVSCTGGCPTIGGWAVDY